MKTPREYEIRLFDQAGALQLVVPIVAVEPAAANARGLMLEGEHGAFSHAVVPQFRSARFAGART